MNNPFLPYGRMRRGHYFLSALAVNAISVVASSAIEDSLLADCLTVALLWPSAMISIQRAHDIGKSAAFGLTAVTASSVAHYLEARDSADFDALTGIGIVAAIAALVMGIMLLLRRGQEGPNQYGPDPLNPEWQAEVFS